MLEVPAAGTESEAWHVRICAGIGLVLGLVGLGAFTDAAPPTGNATPAPSQVDADALPPGHFVGVISSVPDSDRMFTLKFTHPEVRHKPGTRNQYQVVPVTREIKFQADANVKVRIKELPEQFDDKGNIKRYTAAELAALKGKDRNLIGYESSVESLQPGQVVMVSLHSHKKPTSATPVTHPSRKDKTDDKQAEPATEHKMQVTMIVILKDGDAPQSSPPPAKPKKKK
jgi:hypothetical protein